MRYNNNNNNNIIIETAFDENTIGTWHMCNQF